MSRLRQGIKATTIIMAATLLSKVFGLMREAVLASSFGTSYETDAYLMASTIVIVLFASVANGLATTLIPLFSEYIKKNDLKNAFGFTSNLINTTGLIFLIITVVGMLCSPWIIRLLAPGFKGEVFVLAVRLTNIMFIIIVLRCLTYILKALLQSMEMFAYPALIGLPFNIAIIMGTIIASKLGRMEIVAIATIIGVVGEIIIEMIPLYLKGYRYSFQLNFRDERLYYVGKLFLPVIIGTAIYEINILVDRMIASRLGEGVISALNYAYKLNTLILGLFILAIATVIYPMISKIDLKEKLDEFSVIVKETIALVSMFVLPVTVGMIILREPIVIVLFKRGVFDEKSVQMTSTALLFYSLGLIGLGLREVLYRVYFSMKDTKTPMFNGGVALLINIVLNIILSRFMGLAGLALATSISLLLGTSLLIYHLWKRLDKINDRKLVTDLIKMLIASFVMGVVLKLIPYNWILPERNASLSLVIRTGGLIGIGAIVYFIALWSLRVSQLQFIIAKGKEKLQKKV